MNKKKGIFAMALSFGLNNLLAIVLCLLVMTLFSFVFKTNFGWILYALMLFIFAFLIYHQAWQYGSRDLDNKHGKRVLTALSGGLIASVPTFIMAVFSILIETGVYNPIFSVAGQSTVIAAYRLWNMSFRLMFDYLNSFPLLYFVPCIAMPVCVIVGYIFGYKQIKLSDYLYYAREKNE